MHNSLFTKYTNTEHTLTNKYIQLSLYTIAVQYTVHYNVQHSVNPVFNIRRTRLSTAKCSIQTYIVLRILAVIN